MTSTREPPPTSPVPPPRQGRPRGLRTAIGAQTFVKVGLPFRRSFDVYRFAVGLNTRRFLVLFLAAEGAINTIFALLYLAAPGSIGNQYPKGFLGAFFFSLETLATVGYGEMYPGTLYGHWIAALEILVGVGFTALMTGLLFVRFSKPRAKLAYADHPVVTTMNGRPTLVLRFGNMRAEPLHSARAALHMLTRTVSAEGIRQAAPVELALVRSRIPLFAITWTLLHVIDETSPLHGAAVQDEQLQSTRFFLTFQAHDPTIGQEISDLHTFSGADILFGMRYVDAVTTLDATTTLADFSLLSAIEPEVPTV